MNQQTLKLDVKVHPGASKNEITGFRDGLLTVKITARPEKGRANAAVIDVLSDTLGIAKSRIVITRGTSSRLKTIEITGLNMKSIQDIVK